MKIIRILTGVLILLMVSFSLQNASSIDICNEHYSKVVCETQINNLIANIPKEEQETITFVVVDYHTDGNFNAEIMFANEYKANEFGVLEHQGYTIGAMTIEQHDFQEHSCSDGTTSYIGECVEIEEKDGVYYYEEDIILFVDKDNVDLKSGDKISIEKGENNE